MPNFRPPFPCRRPFRRLFSMLLLAVVALLAGCAGVGGPVSPAVAARNALIRAEPPGDYYIGRRYVTERTRFWGYLRRPRQLWDEARLVVMNEARAHVPDRLPELPPSVDGGFGYDHNSQYRVWGRYTGNQIYDPNADLFLPEFQPERFELITASPGFLFRPNQPYHPHMLPPKTPESR